MPKNNTAVANVDTTDAPKLNEASDELLKEHQKEPPFNPASLSSNTTLVAEILRIKNLISNDRPRAPYDGNLHAQRHALVDDIIDGVRNLSATPKRKEELLTLARKHLARTYLDFMSSYVDTSLFASSDSQTLLTREIERIKTAPSANASKPSAH